MAITFVQGTGPLSGGGEEGAVTITWNGNNANLTGTNTCPTRTLNQNSQLIANVQTVYNAIQEWGGGGPSEPSDAGVTTGTTPPTPSEGKLWFQTDDGALYVRSGNHWVGV